MNFDPTQEILDSFRRQDLASLRNLKPLVWEVKNEIKASDLAESIKACQVPIMIERDVLDAQTGKDKSAGLRTTARDPAIHGHANTVWLKSNSPGRGLKFPKTPYSGSQPTIGRQLAKPGIRQFDSVRPLHVTFSPKNSIKRMRLLLLRALPVVLAFEYGGKDGCPGAD